MNERDDESLGAANETPNLPACRPACPNGHGLMVLRPAGTPEQEFCGTWYQCAPGPAGDFCMSATLLPSPALVSQLRGMARTPEEHARIDTMAGDPR